MATRKIPECLNDEQFLDMLDAAAKQGVDVKAAFKKILEAKRGKTR